MVVTMEVYYDGSGQLWKIERCNNSDSMREYTNYTYNILSFFI